MFGVWELEGLGVRESLVFISFRVLGFLGFQGFRVLGV